MGVSRKARVGRLFGREACCLLLSFVVFVVLVVIVVVLYLYTQHYQSTVYKQ